VANWFPGFNNEASHRDQAGFTGTSCWHCHSEFSGPSCLRKAKTRKHKNSLQVDSGFAGSRLQDLPSCLAAATSNVKSNVERSLLEILSHMTRIVLCDRHQAEPSRGLPSASPSLTEPTLHPHPVGLTALPVVFGGSAGVTTHAEALFLLSFSLRLIFSPSS
jgi:hypothetical protein